MSSNPPPITLAKTSSERVPSGSSDHGSRKSSQIGHGSRSSSIRPSVSGAPGSSGHSAGLGIPGSPARRMSFRRGSRVPGAANKDWDDTGHRKAPMAMAPTYRMKPEDNERFITFTAKNIMTGILSSYLQSENYNSTICATMTKTLSELIKTRVMMECKLFSKRYKYVSFVLIGQKPKRCCPSITCSARSVWNSETDNFATANFQKGDLFAVASLFAVYTE